MDPAPDLHGIKDHLYAAVIADILDDLGFRDQVMSAGVRPMLHDNVVVGRARTMLATPRFEEPDPPYQIQIEAVDALEPGDLVVAHLSGIEDAAFWGELFSAAAKSRGAVGAVMDGYIRDTRKVLELGFPLFATGIRPINSKGRLTVEAYDTPVRCGGVLVYPGDIVFAEVDGVVVVPRKVADRVFKLAAEIARKENLMRAELDNGSSLKAAWDKHRVL